MFKGILLRNFHKTKKDVYIKQGKMFNLLEPCSLNQSYIFTVCQVENLRVSNEEVHILLSKIIEISKFVRERKVFSNW